MNENNLWIERWKNREIGFNQSKPNTFLVEHFDKLKLDNNSQVLVPLCGKTIDISWLLSQGHTVVGIELSELAVVELFAELEVRPRVTQFGDLTLYSAENLKVFVGSIFKVTAEMLGKTDAIYDRAAIVALTTEIRKEYTAHLRVISKGAPQLLICFEYNQSLMNRSPYSVEESEVKAHYAEHYDVQLLVRNSIEGGFKGGFPAFDVAWLLK